LSQTECDCLDRVKRFARAAVDFARLVLGREALGEPSETASRASAPAPHGVLHLLFVSREPLGVEPEPPPRDGKPILRWIFGREVLPLDPQPPRAARRGRLAALFTLEKLDDDSR
jgi:hypothetical protein